MRTANMLIAAVAALSLFNSAAWAKYDKKLPAVASVSVTCPTDGNYNGEGPVDVVDYRAWRDDYLNGKAALSCFEYWRRAAFEFGAPAPTSPPSDSRRGRPGDLWADIVLGQPDFAQGIPKEIVSFKVAGPGGVVVDRSNRPNRIYIYDGMNSRVLGYGSLGVCKNNEGEKCSSDSDCPGSACNIQVGGEEGAKKADIVLGQADFNSSACNGDGTFQAYPARTPASDRTLCSLPPDAPSPFEYGSFASMAVDRDGNLYVPDFFNNRVLRFNKPFATDTVADAVWGQDDFSGFACNKGGAADNSSLCFEHSTPNNPLTAGVDIDFKGNLWIADAGNNRVLRFPFSAGKIAQKADLVLGQADFASNSSGSGLARLYTPAAVRVAADGRVFVADADNNRVLVYDPPLMNGMAGREFGDRLKKPTGIEFDTEGNEVWVVDTNNNQLVLFTDAGDVRKVLVKDAYRPDGACGNPGASCPAWSTGYDKCNLCDSRGSLGITSAGDVIAPASSNFQNVYLYKHPIPMPNPGNPYPAAAQFFAPPTGHNYLSNKGFVAPRGIAVTATQLVIADAQRLMFWNIPNGIDDLATGKAADGVAGVPDFKTFADPHYGRIASDGGSLWALRKNRVEQYVLPLSSGETPAKIIYTKDLKIMGSGSSVGRDVEATGVHADPQGKYLWLALPYSDRVVRVRTPGSAAGDFVVDVIIGGNDIPAEDRRWHRPCPSEKSLCAPGAVAEDQRGNLYITDYYLENEGSGRFFRFDKELFPENNNSLLIYDTANAARKFTDVYGWEPAFDSQNRMVIGGAAFTNRSGFPFVYYAILAQTGPSLVDDARLSDHFTQSFSAKFDSADNLYITDMNRGRVLIYKRPL